MYYKRNLVPQIPAQGWHRATIKSIKEGKPANSLIGLSETALTTFVTENCSLITQSFLMAPPVNFMLEKLITVTLGLDDEELHLEDLIGKRCGIKVEHRFSQDRVFANVVDVCHIDELIEDESKEGLPQEELSILGDTDLA